MNKDPILISGIHRSGTTWLGKMLALDKSLDVLHEPFNLGSWSYQLDRKAKFWYTYLPEFDKDEAKRIMDKVFNRANSKLYSKRNLKYYFPFLRKGRILIKDPIASLSSEWIHKNYNTRNIIIVRHPMAFIQSILRVNWDFDFNDLLQQKKLMNELLFPFEDDFRHAQQKSLLHKGAILWKAIYTILWQFIQNNEGWVLVRHEDLSIDPINQFKQLFFALDLNWDQKVEEEINQYTKQGNEVKANGKVHQMKRDSKALATSWKENFSDEDVSYVMNMCSNTYNLYYPKP